MACCGRLRGSSGTPNGPEEHPRAASDSAGDELTHDPRDSFHRRGHRRGREAGVHDKARDQTEKRAQDPTDETAAICPHRDRAAGARVIAGAVTPEASSATVISDVALGAGHSIASRLGDWVGWACLAGMFALIPARRRVRSGNVSR